MPKRKAPGDEREPALRQLGWFTLRCYGEDCKLAVGSPPELLNVVFDPDSPPQRWRLQCPKCNGRVGPDLAPVSADRIILRWGSIGRPPMDNPGASAAFESVAAITELAEWVRKNNPSHLELAYLGQELWPDLRAMFDSLKCAR